MSCGWTNTSVSDNESFTSKAAPEVCDCGTQFHWGWWVLMVLLASVTFLANGLSLVVLGRLQAILAPVLRLALISLSLTDVVGSVSFIYHSIMSKVSFHEVQVECKVRYLFYVSMNVVTMNTLIYMSVERLLAVTAPFVHSRLDGRRFSLVALSCVWICSITVVASGMHRLSNTINVCLYHVMVPKSTHLVNALLGLLGISFIVSVSLVLYARAKREIVKIGRTMVGTEASRRNHLAEMAEKAASTTLAVVVPFATFNTPLYILMLVFYFSPEFMYSCRSIAFLTSFSTLLVVNSLFNPFIYAWKLRPVQAELRKMMPCRARKPGPAPIAVSSTATKFT